MDGTRFSLTDVRAIMSADHRRNTQNALGHEPDVEELIAHWLRFNIPMQVVRFNVRSNHLDVHGMEEPFPLPEESQLPDEWR